MSTNENRKRYFAAEANAARFAARSYVHKLRGIKLDTTITEPTRATLFSAYLFSLKAARDTCRMFNRFAKEDRP